MKSDKKILEVKNVSKDFTSKKICVHAVSEVSFDVNEGETIGIVGESGCGKTTLGRCVCRAIPSTAGEVIYYTKDGEKLDFLKADKAKMKEIRKDIQMIFQNPYSSLDPRMTVIDIIREPLEANFPELSKEYPPSSMSLALNSSLASSLRKHLISGISYVSGLMAKSYSSSPTGMKSSPIA